MRHPWCAIFAKPQPVLRRIQQGCRYLPDLKKVLKTGLTRDGDGHMFRAITRQVVKHAFCGGAPRIKVSNTALCKRLKIRVHDRGHAVVLWLTGSPILADGVGLLRMLIRKPANGFDIQSLFRDFKPNG